VFIVAGDLLKYRLDAAFITRMLCDMCQEAGEAIVVKVDGRLVTQFFGISNVDLSNCSRNCCILSLSFTSEGTTKGDI
jgi:hypothetical protein